MQFCPPRCPSYEGKIAGKGESTVRCAICESLIYQGELRFFNGERAVCEDCARHIDADELCELNGLSDRWELLRMLGFELDIE